MHCHKLNGSKSTFKLLTDAQIIQWNEFSNSEIRPFLYGLLSNLSQTQTRWVYGSEKLQEINDKVSPNFNSNNFSIIYAFRDMIYANRLRNDRINKSLDVLNIMLEKKQFLIGDSYTLADVCVAAQLMPVLDQELGNMYPYLKVKWVSYRPTYYRF